MTSSKGYKQISLTFEKRWQKRQRPQCRLRPWKMWKSPSITELAPAKDVPDTKCVRT